MNEKGFIIYYLFHKETHCCNFLKGSLFSNSLLESDEEDKFFCPFNGSGKSSKNSSKLSSFSSLSDKKFNESSRDNGSKFGGF